MCVDFVVGLYKVIFLKFLYGVFWKFFFGLCMEDEDSWEMTFFCFVMFVFLFLYYSFLDRINFNGRLIILVFISLYCRYYNIF